MEKRNYIKPQVYTVLFHGPIVMTNGSNSVRGFQNGGIINIGDTDDPPSTPTTARENIWDFTEED